MAWALARMLWGPLAAIVALLTIVGSPVVIAEIALFHTDLPAAGLLLALMLLVWYEFERRPEPSRLLIAAAPLAALAFYVRYGSILPIGGIGSRRSCCGTDRCCGTRGSSASRSRSPRSCSRRTSSKPSAARDRRSGSSPVPASRSTRRSRSRPRLDTSGGCPRSSRIGSASWSCSRVSRTRRSSRSTRSGGANSGRSPVATSGCSSRPGSRRSVSSCNRTRSSATSCSRSCSRSSPAAGAVSAAVAWLRARPGLADRQRALDGAVVVGILLVAVIAGSVGARRLVVLEREGDDSRWQPAVGRAIEADADGAVHHRHVGPTDDRVVLTLRGEPVQHARRGCARQLAPSTTRPTSCSRTSTNAERRPGLSQRYRALTGAE